MRRRYRETCDARRPAWRREEARTQAEAPGRRRLIAMQVITPADEPVEPSEALTCTVADARQRAAALARARGLQVVLRVYSERRHRWYPLATAEADGTLTDHACT